MPKIRDLLPWLFGRGRLIGGRAPPRPMRSMAEINAELDRQERVYVDPRTGVVAEPPGPEK